MANQGSSSDTEPFFTIQLTTSMLNHNRITIPAEFVKQNPEIVPEDLHVQRVMLYGPEKDYPADLHLHEHTDARRKGPPTHMTILGDVRDFMAKNEWGNGTKLKFEMVENMDGCEGEFMDVGF